MTSVFRAEGARVAVLEKDRAKCADLAVALPDVPVTEGDATTREANEQAVAAAVAAFGGLDVLVSCVGVFDFYTGLADIDPDRLDEAFDEMYAVNVKAQMHAVRAALPHLRSARGNVVLTESTSAYYPGRGGALYVSSKFAVRGLVTTLAYELAPQVRVNGVAPGGTLNTDLRGLASLGMSGRRLDDAPDRAAEASRPGCPCRSRCPARTTRGAMFSSPPSVPAGSPAACCTPTAA